MSKRKAARKSAVEKFLNELERGLARLRPGEREAALAKGAALLSYRWALLGQKPSGVDRERG